MRWLLALALAAAPVIARAGPIAEGQELAKRGQYDQAIAKFKQADRARPRAETACLIGLAHLRAGHAPEAEVRFAQCRARAGTGDPLPDWLDEVVAELDVQLAQLAPIALVTSGDAPIQIAGWRDEPFDSQPIHLAPGHYAITSGEVTRELDVDGKQRRTVSLVAPPAAPEPPPPPPQAAPRLHPHAAAPSHPSTYVLGAALGLAAIGVGVHALVLAPARTTLETATDGPSYDRAYPAYGDARLAVVGLYGAAAIALGVGLYLRHGEATVIPTVTADGGGVSVAWRR